MEILLAIIGLLLTFALMTNSQLEKYNKRNGFDADDEYDL